MTVALAILGVCFLGAGVVLFRRYAHIFQLNGYKHPVQERWVRDNIEQVMLRGIWALGAAPLVHSQALWSRRIGPVGVYLAAVLFLLVLGLNLIQAAARKREEQAKAAAAEEHDPEIEALLAARTAAKKEKNFAEADRIRDELKARGIEIIDTPQGPKWKRV